MADLTSLGSEKFSAASNQAETGLNECDPQLRKFPSVNLNEAALSDNAFRN